MEALKQNILKNSEKLKYFFIAGCLISCLNCLGRADYNIIVYLYIYYVWEMMKDSKVISKFNKSLGNSSSRKNKSFLLSLLKSHN